MTWAAVTVGAVLLTGCVGEAGPVASASPTDSSVTQISDAELVEQATNTAEAFVALTDRAFAELQVPDELYDLTTDEIAANIASDVDSYIQQGYRLEGSGLLLNAVADSVEASSINSGNVSLRACLDTSSSRVVDSTGTTVSGGGPEQRPVTFEIRWQNDAGRVIATAFPGSGGDSPCEL